MESIEFKKYRIKHGTENIWVSGYAQYQIESLESLGVHDFLPAILDAKIQHWSDYAGNKEARLTFADIKALEESLIDTLNEDSDFIQMIMEKEQKNLDYDS